MLFHSDASSWPLVYVGVSQDWTKTAASECTCRSCAATSVRPLSFLFQFLGGKSKSQFQLSAPLVGATVFISRTDSLGVTAKGVLGESCHGLDGLYHVCSLLCITRGKTTYV